MMAVVRLFDPWGNLVDEAPYFGGHRVVFGAAPKDGWIGRAEVVNGLGVTRVVWGDGADEPAPPYRIQAGRYFNLDWSDENLAGLERNLQHGLPPTRGPIASHQSLIISWPEGGNA